MLAARTRIKYRLEDIFNDEVLIVRYDRLCLDLVERLAARSLFFSGNSTVPTDYPDGAQGAMFETIRKADIPMFGFCSRHQVIGRAFGVPLEPIGNIPDGEPTRILPGTRGGARNRLYFGVQLTADHAVLAGSARRP
ncbi:MAG: hypothetical protein R2706_08025 [Acidimicrobiales bacterium]